MTVTVTLSTPLRCDKWLYAQGGCDGDRGGPRRIACAVENKGGEAYISWSFEVEEAGG